MSFIKELRRRNVVRVGIAYVVVGWLVLQLTEVLSELLNLPDSIGPIVVAIVTIGLPLALFFAWAFEMTPEGIKKEKDVDRSQSIASHTGRKLDFMIIAVLAVALVYFVTDKFFLQPAALEQQAEAQQAQQAAEDTGPRTLAVLPLVNMSADADNEYFSDGLTEELLNILAKIKELRVAGRTSSFAFKGKNEDLREIAEKLNVDTILEGSVRKDDARNKVRITLQLINAEDGYHLWSETYDRDLDDIFAIQEEVAHEVAKALRVTLLGEDEARIAASPQTELTAYEYYLHGLEQLNEFSYSSLPLARDLFQQAIDLDPDYLPARLNKAEAIIQMQTTGLITRQESIDAAGPLIEGVLAQDPENDDAHRLMGRVYNQKRWDEEARKSYRKALDINPRNAAALAALGANHINWGEMSRGLALLKEAERIDPFNSLLLWNLSFAHVQLQDTEGTDAYADRIIDLEPENANPYWSKALVRWFNGDVAEAQYYQVKGHEVDPKDYEFMAGIADMWIDMGDLEQAELWLDKALETGAGEPVPVMAQINLAMFREQPALAADIGGKALDAGLDNRQGAMDVARWAWTGRMLDQGKATDALVRYEDLLPQAFRVPPEYRLDVPFDATEHLEAAVVLQAIDPKSERAAGLVDAAEQKFMVREPSFRPTGRTYNLATVAAVRGNTDQALSLLTEAVDNGFRFRWQTKIVNSPFFRGLRQEPEFRALISRIENDMAEQRIKAYELLELNQ